MPKKKRRRESESRKHKQDSGDLTSKWPRHSSASVGRKNGSRRPVCRSRLQSRAKERSGRLAVRGRARRDGRADDGCCPGVSAPDDHMSPQSTGAAIGLIRPNGKKISEAAGYLNRRKPIRLRKIREQEAMKKCTKCGDPIKFYEQQKPPLCLRCELSAKESQSTGQSTENKGEQQ